MAILLFALLLGLIPAFIAKGKGRSFLGWYIYGAALFIVAFIHVLLIKDKRVLQTQRRPLDQSSDQEGVIVARSAVGQMTFNGREVVISRTAKATNLLLHGLDGEKSIMVSAIQAVQLRQAKGAIRGYLQLTITGGVESQGGTMAAAGDENSLLFDKEDQPAFEAMAEAIKKAVYERSNPAPAAAPSTADEVAKFAKLREEGHLTDEEFATKKRQLLGLD